MAHQKQTIEIRLIEAEDSLKGQWILKIAKAFSLSNN
jgi:hypothetical protein